jgi:hypothetical protein
MVPLSFYNEDAHWVAVTFARRLNVVILWICKISEAIQF